MADKEPERVVAPGTHTTRSTTTHSTLPVPQPSDTPRPADVPRHPVTTPLPSTVPSTTPNFPKHPPQLHLYTMPRPAHLPHLLRLVLLGALLGAPLPAAAPAAATGPVAGRVLNVGTGPYLNNARVSVRGTSTAALTARDCSCLFYTSPIPTYRPRSLMPPSA